MLYQLVLITNLGLVTPLATFDNYGSCVSERARIQNTQQYSAACLPTESPEQIQKRFEQSMSMMLNTMKKISESNK